MVHHRIQRLLEDRTLEAVDPDPEKIATLWEKAVASNDDSRRGLSSDNAIALGYQAGFQACTALLEARGYRVKGAAGGHHQRTFYAASALGYERLNDVGVTSEGVRAQRTKAFYGGGFQGEADVERVHRWLDELLPAIHDALRHAAPGTYLTHP